jgi:hypothetical protein
MIQRGKTGSKSLNKSIGGIDQTMKPITKVSPSVEIAGAVRQSDILNPGLLNGKFLFNRALINIKTRDVGVNASSTVKLVAGVSGSTTSDVDITGTVTLATTSDLGTSYYLEGLTTGLPTFDGTNSILKLSSSYSGVTTSSATVDVFLSGFEY